MNIQKIHIANFGGLSDFSQDFTDGLNCINEKNGWGKTTLAVFIRVMFFGFENDKGRNEIQNERLHYRPWNGGEYGGYVEFAHDGKEYRLVRTFGNTSTGDSFSLLDLGTNLESRDFSSNIGMELFGIDAAGFLHTLFISQDDIDSTATDTVKAKLSNLSGLSDDMGMYADVDKALKDAANSIGGIGQSTDIKLCQEKITSLQMRVNTQPAVDNAIDELNGLLQNSKEELAAEKKALASLTDELNQAASVQSLKAKKEQYDGLMADLAERQRKYDACAAAFSGSIPDATELSDKCAMATQVRNREINLEKYRLSDEENAFLSIYAPLYAAGVPDPEALEKAAAQVRTLNEMEREYASLQFSADEEAEFRTYSEKFQGKGDVSAEAGHALRCLTDLSAREAMVAEKIKTLGARRKDATAMEHSGSEAGKISLVIAGILIILAGIVILFKSVPVGAGMVILGAVLTSAGMVAGRKGRAEDDALAELEEEIASLENQVASEREFIASEKDRIRNLVLSMDLPADDDSIMESLIQLKGAHSRYMQLLEKQSSSKGDSLAAEMQKLKGSIKAFLLPYSPVFIGVTGDADKLAALRANVENYRKYRDEKTLFDNALYSITAEKEPLLDYAASVGFPGGESDIASKYVEINVAFQRYKDADTELKKAQYLVSRFNSGNDIQAVNGAGLLAACRSLEQIRGDIEALRDAQDKTQELISSYKTRLEDSLQKRDDLLEDAGSLSEYMARLACLQKKRDLLKKARELMTTAHTNLTNRYKQPIEDGFRHYCDILDGPGVGNYVVNANMELAVEENGKLHDPGLYSTGTRDKMNLCMRMGLIDAMYKDDKPFVIMDDPFTDFDGDRLQGGKAMVRTLAKDRQIIYLTCHDSRAL